MSVEEPLSLADAAEAKSGRERGSHNERGQPMKISPLELVYTAAILCALILGNTTQTLLGVALGGVLITRRTLHARHAHRAHPSPPRNH